MKTWLVTGGAGFIGSCFVRMLLESRQVFIVNLDKLTYAGHVENIPQPNADHYRFVHGGIEDRQLVAKLLSHHQPARVINFAAESHVDRSIDGPSDFVQTNVVGTVDLLQQTFEFYRQLDGPERQQFRFLHVSTDEVYGSLGAEGSFAENSQYQPNSPYAASKASSDMFVRAFRETYGLPTLLTNCSNNYGPHQFPEKLIPLMILNALEQKPLPVYGDGANIRDWLFVEDHCRAILRVLESGQVGETYNIGGNAERANLQIVESICEIVDALLARTAAQSSRKLIHFVQDRPGHDRRYAIDATKIRTQLGWTPQVSFEEGLRRTIAWYLDNHEWVSTVSGRGYERERLGVNASK